MKLRLPDRLERRTLVYEWPETHLQKLNDAIASLSVLPGDLFNEPLSALEQTKEDVTKRRSEEMQQHLEIWGYALVDPNQLTLELLLPIKPDRQGRGLEKFVIDHCLNILERYGQPEVESYEGYMSIRTPLLGLQQVSGVVMDLSRNPKQLREANTSFAIYQRHPPLPQTYELTPMQPASTQATEAPHLYEQRREKALEYLSRHTKGASRRELVAYLTGAGIGTEKGVGDSIDRMNKLGVIKNVGKQYRPTFVIPRGKENT